MLDQECLPKDVNLAKVLPGVSQVGVDHLEVVWAQLDLSIFPATG